MGRRKEEVLEEKGKGLSIRGEKGGESNTMYSLAFLSFVLISHHKKSKQVC
jgi:hypothetical protein